MLFVLQDDLEVIRVSNLPHLVNIINFLSMCLGCLSDNVSVIFYLVHVGAGSLLVRCGVAYRRR